MAIKAIPEGQHSITPYLCIQDAHKAIDFYKAAFGAVEMFRLDGPDGRVGHAELKIGDSTLMLAEPCDQGGQIASQAQKDGVAVGLHLYVDDADAVYAQALKAGARSLRAPQDQFYGDRSSSVKDPYGNLWYISTHIEDLSPEEIRTRAAAMFSGQG
ncbi:glyoxalase [Pseudomonas sp. SDI]|uniref:VOC family protein n=1 Tax=Pseudomonas sp. SDI TaxID=2170734 RepID=UPI000DE69579|nr:VOC family protein [Pseudomonas sp. SDI]PWB34168.1 glyoxalase [Pseudomonas sp. SDI]